MRFLLLPALVGIVCGALTKPCCVPHKFTGRMTQMGTTKKITATTGDFTNSVYWLDYDYDMKKIMMTGISTDRLGHKHNITVFQDYADQKTYTQYDDYCSVTHTIDDMTPPCIPPNFATEGTRTFGSGSNMLTINSFVGSVGGQHMRMTVTDDCTPVTMTQYGITADNVTGINYSFTFSDIKAGVLSKTNPFVAPSPCKASGQTVG